MKEAVLTSIHWPSLPSLQSVSGRHARSTVRPERLSHTAAVAVAPFSLIHGAAPGSRSAAVLAAISGSTLQPSLGRRGASGPSRLVPCSPYRRPNWSLKRDCHRQGTWPARPSFLSSPSRAKRLPGVSPLAQTLGLTSNTVLSSARPCPAKPASIQSHEGASRHIALGAIERAATRRLHLRSPGLQRLPGSLAVRHEEEVQFVGMQRRRAAARRQFVSRSARGLRSGSRAQAPLAHQFAAEQQAASLAAQAFGPRLHWRVRLLSA